MTTAGPNYPSTAADGGGGNPWTNVANAKADDGSLATATNPADIKLTVFGFAVTAGATIDGVTCEVKHSLSAGTANAQCQIIKGGTVGGSVRNAAANTTLQYATAGGAADLWGNTLTSTDVNAATFGIYILMNTAGTPTYSIDAVRVTINYTLATGAKLSQSKLVAPGVLGRLAQ